MKKTNLIINILFGVAIVVLFVLHFTMGSKRGDVKGTEGNAVLTEQFTAAWVNMDTLMNSYDMYFDMKKELEESGRKKEADLNAKSRSFEKEAYDFQDKVQKGLLTAPRLSAFKLTLPLKSSSYTSFAMRCACSLPKKNRLSFG